MLGTALLLVGNGLLSTLIALRGSLEGYSDQMLGLMGSAYFVGFILGTWVVPPLIRRMGHIRAFNFFAAAIAAIMLLHSIIVDPFVWLALRLAVGVALVGFYTVIESWLNTQAQPERRGQIFAFYMVVNMVAIASAQQFLHFASPAGFILFSIAAMMVCFSVLPVAATRLPQPLVSDVPRLTLSRIWIAAPAALFGALVSGLSMGTFWSLAPVYGARLEMDAGAIATFMTVTIIGGAVMQWPLGRFSDRGDRRVALAVAAGGAAIAAVVMAFFGAQPLILLGAAFVFGGMAFALYPIVVAHLVDHLSQDDILSGSAGILLLHGIGAAIGPTVSGALMGLAGPAAMPAFFAVVFAPMAIYAAVRARRGKDEIVEEAAQFVAMVRTAPTAVEITAAVEEYRIEHSEPQADPVASGDPDLALNEIAEPSAETDSDPGTTPAEQAPEADSATDESPGPDGMPAATDMKNRDELR
jgi:MFS family permease